MGRLPLFLGPILDAVVNSTSPCYNFERLGVDFVIWIWTELNAFVFQLSITRKGGKFGDCQDTTKSDVHYNVFEEVYRVTYSMKVIMSKTQCRQEFQMSRSCIQLSWSHVERNSELSQNDMEIPDESG